MRVWGKPPCQLREKMPLWGLENCLPNKATQVDSWLQLYQEKKVSWRKDGALYLRKKFPADRRGHGGPTMGGGIEETGRPSFEETCFLYSLRKGGGKRGNHAEKKSRRTARRHLGERVEDAGFALPLVR